MAREKLFGEDVTEYIINVKWQTELLRERQHLLHSICNSSLDRSSWEFLVQVEQDKQKYKKREKIIPYLSVGLNNQNKINKRKTTKIIFYLSVGHL